MEEEGERDDGCPHLPPPPPGPGPPAAPPAGPKHPPAGGPERPRRWRRNRNRGRNPVSINVSYIHNNNACHDNQYSRASFFFTLDNQLQSNR